MAKNKEGAARYRRIKKQIVIEAKTEGQQNFLDNIDLNDITICNGMAGTGKAQPLDSIVYTPNGPVRIGDLNIGDEVLTPDGTTAKILGVFDQGKKKIVKIDFSDGTSTECCEDHLWATKTSIERDSHKNFKVRDTKTIRNSLMYRNKKNHSIPITKPVEFSWQETSIPPYLMGLLLGDGTFRHRVGISSGDKEIVNYCQEVMSEMTLVKSGSNKFDFSWKKKITSKGVARKNHLKEIIKSLNLWGTYSHNKFIPNEFKFNTSEVRKQVLAGLLDTDGSITSNGYAHSIEYTTTSEQLSKDVVFLVQSLGGTASVNTRHTNFTYKGIKKQGKLSYRLNICINFNPFNLKRKADKFKPQTKYFPRRYITNISDVGDKEARCILIDSSDHLYLTNDFIVTHNTLLSIARALQYYQEAPETYKKIVIVRPAIQACDEDLGYLPGDIQEKMGPYLTPIVYSMQKFMDVSAIQELFHAGVIEVMPIAFMRGVTFNNCVVVFDESQNSSVEQMKLFLTRIGEDCKAIVEGDITQSDLPGDSKTNNGLKDAMKRLKGVEGVGIVELGAADIVRSRVVSKILERYEGIQR